MDAKDSSSSPTAVANCRDGSVDEDGKGVLSVTAELSKDAALLFQSHRFAECTAVLNQLLQKKEDDPKILHNIAIAEYFRDGCSDPKKLLDVLNKVKKRSEHLARASGVQFEIAGNTGNTVISSGSKGSGTTLHQFSAANTASIAYADEFDTSIVTLNMAVVLYHLQEYALALSLLEPLYQNIEPIYETIALRVCLLLLDVALASKDASRAADVFQYLGRASDVGGHILNQGDDGSVTQQSSGNQTLTVSSSSSGLVAPDASGSDSSAGVNPSETTLSGTLPDDSNEYETLISTLGNSGENMEKQTSNDVSRASTERLAPAIDLKLKLQLYKVRFLLLTRNLKVAKREVKLAMNNSRGRDSSTALLLKSQLEYARGNYRKAIKLLMTSGNKAEAGIISMFNNNLGCIYHHLGKHNSSTLLLSNALRSSSSLRSEKPLSLYTFSLDKSLLILYNCGLQNLFCGRPSVAARCFHKASPLFYRQPLLWLRIAECCLLALEKGLLKSSGSPSCAEEAKIHVAGSGKWRRLIVDPKSRNRTLDTLGEDGLVSNDGRYRLSVPLARQCLLNALHLLNELELKFSKAADPITTPEEDDSNEAVSVGTKKSNRKNLSTSDSKVSNTASANSDSRGFLSSNTVFQSSVSAYEDILREEHHMIRQAVLADLAYVDLCLENPLQALTVANTLQQLPDCSRIYLFLSHVYAAEALCRLNRPQEAAEHLSLYISGANGVELPFSDENVKNWSLEKVGDSEEVNGSATGRTTCVEEPRDIQFLKPEEARGVLYVDLASLSAMQGDVEQAARFVTEAISAVPNNPRALLTAVYVDLLLGKTDDALFNLKRCCSVGFFPSGVSS